MRCNVWLCMYVVRCKSWTIWSQLIAFYKHHLFGRCFASENHSLKMNFEKKMRCTQNRIRTRFKHDSFVDKRGKNLIAKCLVCGVYDCHLYVRESTIFTYRTHWILIAYEHCVQYTHLNLYCKQIIRNGRCQFGLIIQNARAHCLVWTIAYRDISCSAIGARRFLFMESGFQCDFCFYGPETLQIERKSQLAMWINSVMWYAVFATVGRGISIADMSAHRGHFVNVCGVAWFDCWRGLTCAATVCHA